MEVLLLVGSQGDNVRDMHDRDRARKATRDRNGNARLTTEQVEQIRARYVFRKTTYRALAAEFDVHPETVARIVRGPHRPGPMTDVVAAFIAGGA